ncbi:MAG: large subunit ribosomal protein L21 [Microgenomates group bacterium Gr01-1014_5]|nr:MAG: large subunit ribosomal protein L21 [Microgenomates group bacterium Gr01-1014_5]
MKYAVVDIAGKQYKIEEGQELIVDRLEADGKTVFDKVLLVVDGDKAEVGSPEVSGAKVEAEVLENLKGEKIRVLKYKAKSRYRKVRGFRASQTKIKITKIKLVS